MAGQLVLGAVHNVSRDRLTISLAHGVSVVAKIGDVNAVAKDAVRRGAGGSDSDSSDDDAADATPRPTEAPGGGLLSLFEEGQYVSCVVLQRSTDSFLSKMLPDVATPTPAKAKRSVLYVSLAPSLVNDGLQLEHLSQVGSVVWGCVVSKEDHGFVIDIGVAGVHAFLPFKNVASGAESLRPGMGRFFLTAAVRPAASSVVLTHNPSGIAAAPVCRSADAFTLASLKPGVLVNATVRKVRPRLSRGLHHCSCSCCSCCSC
jgi:rRNA biogenesis protein RRP5